MTVPPNLLRSQVEDFEHTPNYLSTKQLARRDRILTTGRHLLALHGLRNLRVCDLAIAIALNITSAAIRFHFADLDALLIEILKEHGKAINKALGAVHHTDPDATAKRRAAYFAATRGPYGNLTEAHLLLVRDATMLSETNYAAIQQSHDQHAIILAGTLDADVALTLLDAPRLDPIRILTTIATLEGTDPALALPFLTPAPDPQPEAIELPPPPQPLPELSWSDDLAKVPDDFLEPYDGRTPGAWVFNPNHARSPPHAA
jgi:AcrR family transcriptional regulator